MEVIMNDGIYVITGASDGLGKQLALSLIEDGKKVICLSRSQPDYEGVEWIQTDLTDEESINQASTKLNSKTDEISALVNNAGIMNLNGLGKLNYSDIRKSMDANVSGHILLTSKINNKLKHGGSVIVNVSSTVGLKGYANQEIYGATKWAVRGFSESLREDFKESLVRVVSFCPGGMNDNFHQKVTGEELLDPENWMDPKDVANLLKTILYLPKSMEVSEIVINRKKKVKP